MSSGTTDYTPVPETNGFSIVVPSPGLTIWRQINSDGSTAGGGTHYEKVYPMPPEQHSPGKDHG
jgi:hypothetical protein